MLVKQTVEAQAPTTLGRLDTAEPTPEWVNDPEKTFSALDGYGCLAQKLGSGTLEIIALTYAMELATEEFRQETNQAPQLSERDRVTMQCIYDRAVFLLGIRSGNQEYDGVFAVHEKSKAEKVIEQNWQ